MVEPFCGCAVVAVVVACESAVCASRGRLLRIIEAESGRGGSCVSEDVESGIVVVARGEGGEGEDERGGGGWLEDIVGSAEGGWLLRSRWSME